MTKKLMLLPLVVIGVLFFVKCSKDLNDPDFDMYASSGKKGPPNPTTETTNNLSYPVIAVDLFPITPITTTSFLAPYTGDYPGLTAAEIAALGDGPWYAQKITENVWQADFLALESSDPAVIVNSIDWGDVIESQNPVVRRPFSLEVTLYKDLNPTLTGYTMAVLENPSSIDELQGTNTVTYESLLATIVSLKPKFIIQNIEGYDASVLVWDALKSKWTSGTDDDPLGDPVLVPISFGPELNIGGKYIYGASSGGWKPTSPGKYRLTFYVPSDSQIDFDGTVLTNIPSESPKTTPVIDDELNLTYVDVIVIGRKN